MPLFAAEGAQTPCPDKVEMVRRFTRLIEGRATGERKPGCLSLDLRVVEQPREGRIDLDIR